MGSLLFFLGRKNIVYPLWQSSFVKVSGNQITKRKNSRERGNPSRLFSGRSSVFNQFLFYLLMLVLIVGLRPTP
jgi:hypothetical protein